ncbi:MAG: LemA family protein [Candidatus Omnitrophica bacterium]|nr:LemA family protein [Candidatus Omnitrophota bacterium]
MSRITETIKKMFPKEFEELIPIRKPWWEKIDFAQLQSKEGLWVSLAIGVVILGGIYYYNKLIAIYRFTEMESHQIEVQLQRRKDLSANLVKTVMDYAEHERQMFQYMADKRAEALKTNDLTKTPLDAKGLIDPKALAEIKNLKGVNLDKALAKIMALAEAYPQLKLSENFQILMQGLIKTEDNIADRRMAYNEAASNYHAYVKQIPACFYAYIFGYREKMFHYAEVDPDIKKFNPIAY